MIKFPYSDSIPYPLKYILILFVCSRIVLVLIGLLARHFLDPFHHVSRLWRYSNHEWLDIWGAWDSSWYIEIARNGYSAVRSSFTLTLDQANYAFFPLYPLLVRACNFIVGDYFISGLIISNVSFLVAAWLFFKLIRIDTEDDVSVRIVNYFFIFPTAFIFSTAYSESLYMVILIGALYSARRQRWWLAAVLGFLLSLTRPIGVFIILPLAYEYYQSYREHSKSKNLQNIIWLTLIPIGFGIFYFYVMYITGSTIALFQIQEAWGRSFQNPFVVLWRGLHSDLFSVLTVILVVTICTLLVSFWQKLRVSYLMIGLYSIIIPLSTGLASMPRYLLAAMPLYIVFSMIGRNKTGDIIFVVCFSLVQGFLFALWSIGVPAIM